MRQHILNLIVLLFSLTVHSQTTNLQHFYVGTFTSEGAEGFYLCSFNTETGDVELTKTFKGSDNPNFLCLSPDKEYLYVATRVPAEVERSGGYICAYKVGENGNLKFLNKQVSNGNDPCHVDVSPDGKFVAIATYGGGTTSLYPVNEDGSLAGATTVIENSGSGPDKARQSVPHAHSIRFSPFENEVFSADLGTDQLNIYRLENGELICSHQNDIKMAPGAGPRHFEFHPNAQVIYVINELNSTITAVRKEKGQWDAFQNISTLPKDFKGESYCADIHISADAKYIYGSNRGHNSIAVFEVNPKDQTLEILGTVPVEGNWPRNFRITPDGKWMLVANQKSGDITVFKINKTNGIPEFSGKRIELSSPVCIDFL
ncbi:lactonase family protein [Prolixibacteraceae bacterium Z1-6]|uniref:Lactonase family protein n=1 Tax=Draconibacterium aestuarii TaxID=2998507 RepID=A0A9X3J8G9_9BACT|nr:lactonase family protein [Prolixibacteraceae bacterium Z1-6]